ncbi:MAG: hypothetical protein ACK5Q5_23040 [Planctomycetaceae bacterium]
MPLQTTVARLSWLAVLLCASTLPAAETIPLPPSPPAAIGLPRMEGIEESLQLFEPPRQKPPLLWDGVQNPAGGVRIPELPNRIKQVLPAAEARRVMPAPIPVPVVDQQQFRRRVIVLPGQGMRIVVTSGRRGRDAWTSSILRTTKIDVARQMAEGKLDDVVVSLAEQHQLNPSQCDKLRLAGLGDINRFLTACELFVANVTTYESTADKLDDAVLRDYWEQSCQLRDQLSAGLHGPDSLLRKQWEREWSAAQSKGNRNEGTNRLPTATGGT